MSSSNLDAQLRVLLNAAEQAEARGQAAEAARHLAQAKALAPNHEAVLNAQAIAALKAGNIAAGRELLERAVRRNGDLPALWVNLASACREAGDIAGERQALDRALALAPRDYILLLQKGALIERSGGQAFEACGYYQQALGAAPPADQVPQPFVQLMNHAVNAVRAQSAQMEQQLEAALAPVRAAHEGESHVRVDYAVAAMLGKTRIFVPQPTFLQIPGIPFPAFFDRGQLPWLADLEASWEAIAGEARAVLEADPDGFVPFVAFEQPVAAPEWAPLNQSKSWAQYALWKEGAPVEAHLARCPATAALIDRLPLADLPGNAPNVSFMLLAAGTRIPPHLGVTNARATVELPLVVPEQGYLRVGAEVRTLKAGEAYAYDDAIEHENGNTGSEAQLLLVLDAWNPHVTESEKALLRAVFRESAAFSRRSSMFAGRL